MSKKLPLKYLVVVEFPPTVATEKFNKFAKEYSQQKQVDLKLVLLHDRDKLKKYQKNIACLFDYVVKTNFLDDDRLQEDLLPFGEDIIGVICRAESHIPKLAALIPHIPYVKLPTEESLLWSVNKLSMRRRFKKYNPKITPKFMVVKDFSEVELDKIEKKLHYPLLVKPFGLAQSLLVTNVYHRDELKKVLKKSFKVLDQIYKETDKIGEQGLLVEEMMEGTQYSIDSYVNSKGKVYHCPIVHVKTGKQIGFDDYFGYRQMTPTKLSKQSEGEAQQIAEEAIHALGLRSSTAHVELMRTEEGWKVIEVAPRVGGFREQLYEYSYGFDHAINDLLIRIGKPPKINRKALGYSAALKIYAPKEGLIESIKGMRNINQLESFKEFVGTTKRKGDKAIFAKNGGSSVAKIILFNKSRSKLLADIRRIESNLQIEIK